MSEKQTLSAKHDPVSPASPDVVEQAPEASPFMAALLQRQATPPPIKPRQKDILHLQRLLGNAATRRYLHSSSSTLHLQRERVVDDDLDLRLPAALPSYDDFVTLVSQQRALRARMIARSDGGEHILDILRTHSNLQAIYHQIETLYSAGGGAGPTMLHAQLHYEDSPGDTDERVDHIDFSLPGVTTIDFDDDRVTSTGPEEEEEDEDPFGLETAYSRDTFVEEAVAGLIPRWPGLTPAERRDEVFALINRRLNALGIPSVDQSPVAALSPGTNAQFDAMGWAIEYVEARFSATTSAADINHLLSDFYHEARHAEQVFLGLRYFYRVAGPFRIEWLRVSHFPSRVRDAAYAGGALYGQELIEARQYYEIYIYDPSVAMAVETEVDDAAYALSEARAHGTPEEIEAARQRRDAAQAAYRALVNEADAYDVGDEVRGQLDEANPGP